jgi:hypothetical protein
MIRRWRIGWFYLMFAKFLGRMCCAPGRTRRRRSRSWSWVTQLAVLQQRTPRPRDEPGRPCPRRRRRPTALHAPTPRAARHPGHGYCAGPPCLHSLVDPRFRPASAAWSVAWPPRIPPGATRVHGELAGLGYPIGASTTWYSRQRGEHDRRRHDGLAASLSRPSSPSCRAGNRMGCPGLVGAADQPRRTQTRRAH